MSKPKTEFHNILINFFFLAFSALLITTKSSKDCEDGFFTGYLVSLSMFCVCVFFQLISNSIVDGYRLKTDYYRNFFYKLFTLNFIILFLNFMGNLFASNDCGFYSIRGFVASLISVCSFFGILFVILLNLFLSRLISLIPGWKNDKFYDS